ncbi:MAG: hypothetical protein EOP53_09750 [Sphingobacteriales bacterium]|nr:MAG: hypothetical protein EOP53_09750 [Sphingobacteriales bacterium]
MLELKQDYLKERKTEMSEDQFAALVYTFPSILVAHADGKIDRQEKQFMRELPELLTEGYMEDGINVVAGATLTKDYFSEVNFIIKHLENWEARFLEALKEQLHSSLNERNAIFEMMWRTADSSKDISEEERVKIEEISAALGL